MLRRFHETVFSALGHSSGSESATNTGSERSSERSSELASGSDPSSSASSQSQSRSGTSAGSTGSPSSTASPPLRITDGRQHDGGDGGRSVSLDLAVVVEGMRVITPSYLRATLSFGLLHRRSLTILLRRVSTKWLHRSSSRPLNNTNVRSKALLIKGKGVGDGGQQTAHI